MVELVMSEDVHVTIDYRRYHVRAAERIDKLIEKVVGVSDYSAEVASILTDIMHFCVRENIDFADRVASAVELFSLDFDLADESELADAEVKGE